MTHTFQPHDHRQDSPHIQASAPQASMNSFL
jgi:hypothetical protein